MEKQIKPTFDVMPEKPLEKAKLKLKDVNPDDLIRLKKNRKYPYIYDVIIQNVEQIKQLGSFECHLVLYPYERTINSDDMNFNPFEEYVEDIKSEHRSVYINIEDNSNKLFGMFLGLLILFIFARFKPEILLSVESIVSIFAAYTIGKEIWKDLQKGFSNLTKKFRLKYIEPYYSYRLEKRTTLTRYSNFARRNRLKVAPILPTKMDFIYQSNSQTLRLKFRKDDFANIQDKIVHIFTLRITPEKETLFEKSGFLFGAKISFNKHFLGFRKSIEYYQSLHFNTVGCIDKNEVWLPNKAITRKSYTFRRLRYHTKTKIMDGIKMIRKSGF